MARSPAPALWIARAGSRQRHDEGAEETAFGVTQTRKRIQPCHLPAGLPSDRGNDGCLAAVKGNEALTRGHTDEPGSPRLTEDGPGTKGPVL